MTVNSTLAASRASANTVALYDQLDVLLTIATELTSGAMTALQVIRRVQAMSEVTAQASSLWAALAAVRSTQENTAIGAVVTAKGNLLAAIKAALSPLTGAQLFDMTDDGMPAKSFTLPSSITTPAAALVTAIGAFKAT